MTEIQRWKTIVSQMLIVGTLKPGQIPGYIAPSPLATVKVPSLNDPTTTSTYWSFQAMLQRRTEQLVGSSAFRSTATTAIVHDLLNQTADDAVAYLGSHDPDLLNRKALVKEYVQIYTFGTTSINGEPI